MKILRANEHGRFVRAIGLILPATLLALSVAAQDRNASTNTAAKVARIDEVPAANRPPAKALSPGVSEILKMADAGVSTEVIKTYVESSATVFEPTHEDIIAMNQHKVGDEVITLLIRRGTQARAAIAQAKKDAVARVELARRMGSGGLDPESYEFFQYYYLQPRALASAYERLDPYHRLHRPLRPYAAPSYSRLP